MRYLPTPGETALLVVLNLQRYAKDRGKDLGRFRMARSSLRRISVRTRLEDSWIAQFIEHMLAEHGWLVFLNGDEFLFLRSDSAASWTKLSSKRCDDLLNRFKSGDASAIDDAEKEVEPEGGDEDEDDGD